MATSADEQRADSNRAFAQAVQAGIHVIPVPTPFGVGTMNAYLIEDEPLTLIDSGPNSALSLDRLAQGLGEVGHSLRDLGLLIITHPHMDHSGLLDVVGRRSGATIAALDIGRAYVESFGAETIADNIYAQRLMVRHGVAPSVSQALRGGADVSRAWGCSTPVTEPLHDGGTLRLRDRTLSFFHRPGHSCADTLILDASRGIAFTGDHLIAHISSNPLLTRPAGAELDYTGPRPRPLIDFQASLRATRADPISLALSGHGDPITDVEGLIERRLAGYERRADRIAELLERGPLTAYEIAEGIWGKTKAMTQTYLALSEVLAHVDLLVERGQAVEDEVGGTTAFRLASV